MKRKITATAAVAAALVLSASLGACEPVEGRYIDIDHFAADEIQTVTDITYGEAPALPDDSMPPGGIETLKLDLYMPKVSVDPETQRPGLLWIHGGGFKNGSKSSVADRALEWASRGYVVVAVDYRLDEDNLCDGDTGGQPVPPDEIGQCRDAIRAAQHDAQGAVRWLRSRADALDLDPGRIAATGGSAGAVTAFNLAYNSDDPGTSNDLPFPSDIQAATALSGAALPNMTDMGPGDAPVMDAHCTNDPLVDWETTEAGLEEARSHGLVAEALVWSPPDSCAPGHVHAGALLIDHGDQINLAFAQFNYRHLGLSQTED